MHVRLRRSAVIMTAVSAASALAVGLAPAATAASGLTVSYTVAGSTHVAKPNAGIGLGPAPLTATISPSGSFTGSLNLPGTSTTFKIAGLVPVSATVNFVLAKPLTGTVVSNPTPHISATAAYYVKLSNVHVFSFLPIPVGGGCQTASPVSMTVAGAFNVIKGGTITGSYSIGGFSGCGLATPLLNLLISGGNNTVSLTMSNGKLVTS